MARRNLDQYNTPRGMTQALVQRHVISGRILEPCSGRDAITDVLRMSEYPTEITTNDIDRMMPSMYHYDAGDPALYRAIGRAPDWIVTNPPFLEAAPILELALKNARVGVAFLLRITFMEPTKGRHALLRYYSDNMVGFMPFGQPRPNYRRGERNPDTGKAYGGDSTTSAWFVWRPRFSWQRDTGVVSPFTFVSHWE